MRAVGIYHGAKYAAEGISEALAKEITGSGIKVTIIELGAFRTDFGTRSLTQADPLPGYESVREFLEQAVANASSGEPVRAAQAMIQAVEAEEPPLRLALGADALYVICEKLTAELESYKQWEFVSVSTAFPTEASG
jgi:NAD(P)-dependent dehydrogenase (short-subunit alcohol dehydrogenase family)